MPQDLIARPQILFATDFGEISAKAIQTAIQLERVFRGELVLFHSVEPVKTGLFSTGTPKGAVSKANAQMQEYAQTINPDGKYRVKTLLGEGKRELTIPEAAREIGAKMIIFGIEGGPVSLRDALRNDEVRTIIHNAPCPVITIREAPVKEGFKKIMVIVDIGSAFEQKVRVAVRLAHKFEASIQFFSPIAETGIDQYSLNTRMKSAIAEVEQEGIPAFGEFREIKGPIDEGILAFAEEKEVDLLLLMTDNEKDNSGLSRRLWGTDADRVIHSSSLPVVTIRPKRMYAQSGGK